MTVTTGDEKIRRLFEPYAPPIKERISALGELHSAGIRTFAMIAPMLPKAEELVDILDGKVDYALIDRMNYHHADWVYRKYQLERPSLSLKSQELCSGLEKCGISCRVLFR